MPHEGPEPTPAVGHRNYLTKREFVERSGLSPATVQRYVRDGRIPYFQPGGRGGKLLFPPDAIEAAAGSSPAGPAPHADAPRTARDGRPAGPAAGPAADPAAVHRPLRGPRPRWRTGRQPNPKE
jgi:hypothetical protein